MVARPVNFRRGSMMPTARPRVGTAACSVCGRVFDVLQMHWWSPRYRPYGEWTCSECKVKVEACEALDDSPKSLPF
jgi:hypothetical protein